MADFTYNSQRETLIIPEYGRHIQKMIQHTKQIEDPEKRQRMAHAIIQLMNQMVPQSKDVVDFEKKLWAHLFKIADYDIDVVTTKGEKIERPDGKMSLQNLPYTQTNLKYRHYGKNIMHLIEKAKEMEPGEKRDGCIQIIAAYMKLAYRNWNRDHYVNDENIRSDLKMMTKGELTVPEEMRLDILAMSGPNAPANTITSSKNSRKRRNNNKSNKRHNKRRRR